MAAPIGFGAYQSIQGNLVATVQRSVDRRAEADLPLLFGTCDFSGLSQGRADDYVDLVIGRVGGLAEGEMVRVAALIDRAARPIFLRASPAKREALKEAIGNPILREAYQQTLSEGEPDVPLNPYTIQWASLDDQSRWMDYCKREPEVPQFLTACQMAYENQVPSPDLVAAGLKTGFREAAWLLPHAERLSVPDRDNIVSQWIISRSPFFSRCPLLLAEDSRNWNFFLWPFGGVMDLDYQPLIWETFTSDGFDRLREDRKQEVLRRLGIAEIPGGTGAQYRPQVYEKLRSFRMAGIRRVQKVALATAAVALAALFVSSLFWIGAVALAGYGVHAWRNRLIHCEDEARRAEFMRRLEARPEAG